jgi:hypothetical protein
MALAQLLSIPSVRNFLFDGKVMAEYRAVAEKHHLPKERAKEFLDLCNAILDEKLPLAEVPTIISQAFGVSEDEAKKISADIVGFRILPVSDFVPGVPEQITAWGGELKDYQAEKVGKEKITGLAWAERLNLEIALGFSDVLVKRLALLLEGRVKGEKTAEAFKTFLGRPLSIGGLALPKEKLDALVVEVERETPYTEIVSEAEYQKMTEEVKKIEEPDEAAEPQETPQAMTKELEIAPSHELMVTDKLKMATDAAVAAAEEIITAKNIPVDKFRSLAEKNIRGVREPGQTRDILESEYKLSGVDLRMVLEALATGKKLYDGEKPAMSADETPHPDEEKQEMHALDQKFAALTKSLPEENIAPIAPGARVSAARETSAPSTKKVVPLKPRPAKAELTVGSVAPKAPERKMTDVVKAARLMGPIDQLKNMSTVEFRRLSSDPQEAARKVEDILSALMATSYEEKISGIKAWRMSPMNQLYLSISEEALSSGLPLPDVCSKWRKAGKDCLSPAEIKAIVALNSKLRS